MCEFERMGDTMKARNRHMLFLSPLLHSMQFSQKLSVLWPHTDTM